MRTRKFLGMFLLCFVVFAGFAIITGCSGDTSGGEENYEGSQFVATDDSVGTISIEMNQTEFSVADTTGFRARVVDAQGAPVPGITVACDSELGIAILEPTTGREITDSYGSISGKIGCKYPGSFQFGCRLPIGGNRRQLVGIKCRGNVPEGFDGFPGSAGGGLGTGGVDVEDTGTVRITSIVGSTIGGTSFQIDTTQNVCSDATVEPFSDDSVVITVVNNTSSNFRVSHLEYQVPGADVGGGTFYSDPIALVCEAAGSGGSTQCSSLFIQARGSGKAFYGAAGNTTVNGFRSITFRLTGILESTGEEITISGKTAFSFGNFDNCGG